jgi:hypothetical protein
VNVVDRGNTIESIGSILSGVRQTSKTTVTVVETKSGGIGTGSNTGSGSKTSVVSISGDRQSSSTLDDTPEVEITEVVLPLSVFASVPTPLNLVSRTVTVCSLLVSPVEILTDKTIQSNVVETGGPSVSDTGIKPIGMDTNIVNIAQTEGTSLLGSSSTSQTNRTETILTLFTFVACVP